MKRIEEVLILEQAADDMFEIREFYELQNEGLGIYFWDSIISDIESLKVYAGVHQKYRGIFRMLARRFPCAMYYQIEDSAALLGAVLPMKRDPRWISTKVRNRT